MNLLRRSLGATILLASVMLWASLAAHADGIVDDPLHGFCYGVDTCSDQNIATPVLTSSPLDFGFSISPGPQTGTFFVDILIPVALDPTPSSLSFAITGTQGGASNTSALSATAVLYSTTAFGSGDLATYLKLPSSSPANPIGAFQNAEQVFGDGNSTDTFYVYQANLGTNQLQPNSTELTGPLLQVSGLPTGASIVGFLEEGSGTVATAMSGQILTTPEPGTFSLLGIGLLGLVGLGMSRRSFVRS